MEPTRPPAGTRSKLNTLVLWDNVLEIKHVAGSQDLQYGVLIRSLFAVHDCCERIGTRDQTWWVKQETAASWALDSMSFVNAECLNDGGKERVKRYSSEEFHSAVACFGPNHSSGDINSV
ncbi:hypothetical protein AB1N83_006052 [Pleurotus pulmonarius]